MGKTFKKVATVAAVAYGGYHLYGAMTAAGTTATAGSSLLPAAGGSAPAFGSVGAIQAIGSPTIGGSVAGSSSGFLGGMFGGGGSSSTFLGLSSPTWSALGTAGSMLGNVRAGQAQEVQYQMQAQQEADAAKDRELQRKQQLIAAIASQRATRGAQGITMAGSPAGMIQSDIDSYSYGSTLDAANTSMAQQQYLTSGKYAAKSGYTSAANTLLRYGERQTSRESIA